MEEVHPVLDARHTVGDLGEVAAAEFLLALEDVDDVEQGAGDAGELDGAVGGGEELEKRAAVPPRVVW
ncbi:hypothetical protein [Streptomyces bugieae]|uniref:Uncharacterized protein n=1 Tax=Streptomyces bugieae TaxID=3098223 RepID=A0ABU7NRY3_9ACTN|nr:hypothetical protein [Streptomyces sp. DSM 41528]